MNDEISRSAVRDRPARIGGVAMLINGRTPEEIKASIKCCHHVCTEKCSYYKTGIKISECTTPMSRDAFALIEHLEAERDAALAKVPKWISVKDRLPESYDEKADCFLVTDGEFIWMAYYACKEWQFAQCTNSPYVIDWTEITHWMPLHEPPRGADK